MHDFQDTRELLERYFPLNDIPAIEERLDTPGRKEQHPGPRNGHGYRSDDFRDRGDFNIAYLGCSWVEGSGVEREEMFSELVSRGLEDSTGLSIRSWNLGLSGTGIDHAMRLAPTVITKLRPDFVVLVVSGADRREYFSPDGRRMAWTVALPRKQRAKGVVPPPDREIIEAFETLQTPHNDLAYLLRNLRALALLLDYAKIPWAFSWIDRPAADEVMQLLMRKGALPGRNFIGNKFERVDKSTIDQHPGPISHERFAASVTSYLLARKLIAGKAGTTRKDETGASLDQSSPIFSRLCNWLNIRRKTATTNDSDDVYPLW